MLRRGMFAAVLGTTALFSSVASAQPDDVDAKDVAHALDLADRGQCDLAVPLLARAADVAPTMPIMTRLGECLVAQGRLIEGTDDLAWVLRQPMPADGPLRSVGLAQEAKDRAKKALAAAQPRIAKLKIAVAAPSGAEVTIQVDDVATATRSSMRFVDPGEHVVLASAPGFTSASATVRVGEGGAEAVALVLEPKTPLAASAEEAIPSAPLRPIETTRPAGRDLTGPIFVMSVGAAGIGAGAILGLVAMNKTNHVKESCVNDVCPRSVQSDVADAHAFGTASTVALVAGFGAAAAGAVWLLALPEKKAPSSARVTPVVGPGSAGVAGTF